MLLMISSSLEVYYVGWCVRSDFVFRYYTPETLAARLRLELEKCSAED